MSQLELRSLCPLRFAVRTIYRYTHAVLSEKSIKAVVSSSHEKLFSEHSTVLIQPLFDPIAQAFVIWKCYCECCNDPGLLFGERLRHWPDLWQDADKKHFGGPSRAYDNWRLPGSWEFMPKSWDRNQQFQFKTEVQRRLVAIRCFAIFDEILARLEAIVRGPVTDFFPVQSIDGRYKPMVNLEYLGDGCRLICFRPAPRVLDSPFVNRWLERVPSKNEVRQYARRLGRGVKHPRQPKSFCWPVSGGDLEYFLPGPG